MNTLKTYSIPFKGLKLGKHQFVYEIGDSFFDEFEYSIVKKGKLNCVVELEKQETMMLLNFEIGGIVSLACDRCLADFPENVTISERQIVKFGEHDEEEEANDEIMVLNRNDYEIDLSGLIYEYINLAIPLISVCNDEGNTPYCDQEMLERLKQLAANDDNEPRTKPDPRWDALKKIK